MVTSKTRMQRFVNALSERYALGEIIIDIKDTKVGRARRKTNRMTIPVWLCECKWVYISYYLIHEICHFISPLSKLGWHGVDFKKVEDKVLSEYGLKIERAKVYARKVFKADRLVWQWGVDR